MLKSRLKKQGVDDEKGSSTNYNCTLGEQSIKAKSELKLDRAQNLKQHKNVMTYGGFIQRVSHSVQFVPWDGSFDLQYTVCMLKSSCKIFGITLLFS